MAFSGKTVYIAGGSGTVGKGLTRTFLKNGAKVAVSSRTQDRLDELKKCIDNSYHSNLILIKEDASTEKGASNILKKLKDLGGVQHVMSTMGSWWQGGPLTKQSVEEYDKALNDRARSHFICAKTFLPYLAQTKGSTYTFFSGILAENCDMADCSLIVVAGGCLYGISEAARAEFKDSNVAVSEVRIGLFIVPQLDKDLDTKTFEVSGKTFDKIGNDVIGDFTADVVKSRACGVIRFDGKKEMDACWKKLKG